MSSYSNNLRDGDESSYGVDVAKGRKDLKRTYVESIVFE